MKYIVSILIILLAGVMSMALLPASAQDQKTSHEWTGKLSNGKILTEDDLSKIIKEHKEWFSSKGEHGKRADLINADLIDADLSGAYLYKADLSGANLIDANLIDANLERANLSWAYLYKADLRDANLREADLSGAYLIDANLERANLSWAYLYKADLSGANLREANLSGAYLREADLRWANLEETNFKEADVSFADFTYSKFEPENIEGFIFLGAKGFSTIRFVNFKPITDLRKVAKESGLRNEEKALTAALRKYRLSTLPLHEQIFEYILLDLPTDSGANPWRSFYVLAFFIVIFSCYYIGVLKKQGKDSKGKDGIHKIWIPERVRKDLGKNKPTRLTLHGWSVLRVGLYFSVLSAFNIGWRELNVGNWIARIQRREYIYRATGWTRTVSGIQSLLSVYLLALWALTYFGRPFE